MNLQFLASHHIIIIILLYPILLASAQEYSLAKPGCNSTCGDVTIPYPFGMKDPKCYAHEWFEIDCRRNINTTSTNTNTYKPYLKSLNLEVTDINQNEGKVEIMNPIYRWNCQSKNARPVINMRGSPYVYSKQGNKFVAVGCNKLAFLRSNGSTVSGCVSICDDNEAAHDDNIAYGPDGCVGRYCCETSLPIHLAEYNATIQDLMNNQSVRSEGCSYELIVDEDWLEDQYRGYYLGSTWSLSDLNNLDYVPAVLEWEIPNYMLTNNNNNNNNSTLELSSDAHTFCTDTNITSAQNTTSGRRCRCLTGNTGTGYIKGSCAAIPGFYDEKSKSKWTIVGVSSGLGSIILLIGVWFSYKVVKKRLVRKRKVKFFKKNGGLMLQQRLSSGEAKVDKGIHFSLKDLEKATDNFNQNRVLGKGGQGTVYKGMLADGKIVAVKKFKVQGNAEEFINEFVILSQINHRNIVKLLGCCLETEIPLLVYEFIPNGNLFEYLHDQSEDLPMTWDMRLRMATEIAGALFYLHSVASQPIYHRDIKSTNILLDEKYRAKVADFGTSRIVSIEATHLTTAVQGTFGYLDPEYFHTSQFTEKSDVYSFGVVLVELLTGEKPISSIRPEEAKSLASYFVVCVEENRLFDIIDKRVMEEGEKEHIIAMANLAYRCLELNGRKRPTMKEVTLELEGIRRLDQKNNDVQQSHEEIEISRIEDYQLWIGCDTSDTLPTTSSNGLSSRGYAYSHNSVGL